MSSEEEAEPYTVTLPPALLSSSDEETRVELRKIGLVPPPQPFANGLLIKETPKATLSISPSGSRPSIAKTSSGKASDSTADSGVEDPHMETTSTVSTVSSMSTLSSESTDSTHASKPRSGVGVVAPPISGTHCLNSHQTVSCFHTHPAQAPAVHATYSKDVPNSGGRSPGARWVGLMKVGLLLWGQSC